MFRFRQALARRRLGNRDLGLGSTTADEQRWIVSAFGDTQRQKVTLKQARLAGVESVTVPAGTFKAFKVELTSAEGDPGQTTVWVAGDSRKVVRIAATLPRRTRQFAVPGPPGV